MSNKNVCRRPEKIASLEVVSSEPIVGRIKEYKDHIDNTIKIEAENLSKSFSLDFNYALFARVLLGSGARRFIEYYQENLNGRVDYIIALQHAYEVGFSELKDSVFDDAMEIIDKAYGINPGQTEMRLLEKNGKLKTSSIPRESGGVRPLNMRELTFRVDEVGYRNSVEDSSHHAEHFDSRMDRQED